MTSGEGNTNSAENRRKPGCRSLFFRVLQWGSVIIFILVVAGVVFQLASTASDRQNYQPIGDILEVDNHRMHLYCVGEGAPTIILEAGGISFSLEWYWVQQQLSATHRVCAYDRAGSGWSEPSSLPRTATQITQELNALLRAANIKPPFVLVGHSYGGVLSRVYAHQFPDQVIGLVLVDSAILLPDTFATEDAFLQWKRENDLLQVFLWAMVRTGIYRLTIGEELRSYGYPDAIARQLTALRASNQAFDTYYAEAVLFRRELTQEAVAAQNLGTLPLAVLWATDVPPLASTQSERLAQLQQAVAAYSSNSIILYVDGANHGSIIGTQQFAQEVTNAILRVVDAAENKRLLNP
jgi:pimeloyl-ACP methyl ester carboxylesterase